LSRPESTSNQQQTTLPKQTLTEEPLSDHAFDYVEPDWVYTGHGGPLPEYDWGPASGPQSGPFTPAGQVDGVHEEEWYSTAQTDVESDRLHHSQQHNTSPQESDHVTNASDISATNITPNTTALFECEECSATFPKRHIFNKHMKKHYPPFPCDDCNKAFRYRKDLTRHCNSIHPETVDEPKVSFCPVHGCKYSTERSTGSTRGDNLRRHIRTQHGW
jgi:uncharacterized C2H2 Zn-finger protein